MFSRIKRLLKKNPIFFSFNAFIKSRKTTFDQKKLDKYYQKLASEKKIQYVESSVIEKVKEQLFKRGVVNNSVKNDGLNIFWVGANYDQDNSGFLQGLSKFGRVNIFRNEKGEYGLEYSSRSYDPEIIIRNDECLLRQVEEAYKKKPIQLLLGQMWATLISSETLKRIREKGIITINIAMDDKLPEHWKRYKGIRLGCIGLAEGLDLVAQTSPDYCVRYATEGHNALYFPLASDPDIFKPQNIPKRYDVCFVGSNYGIRTRIVRAIEKSGVKVETFGPGWSNGSIDSRKTSEVFARSRIILGIGTVAYNEDILTLKLRDFDGPMSGTLYITHRNPDLNEFFEEGKEIELYGSIEECVRKINYYLKSPDEREKIAKAGRSRAMRDHTWEKRFEKLFNSVGILE